MNITQFLTLKQVCYSDVINILINAPLIIVFLNHMGSNYVIILSVWSIYHDPIQFNKFHEYINSYELDINPGF